MDKIKNFEDACKALGVVPSTINLEGIPEKHRKAVLAHYQLIIISEALNEGWVPDWNDDDQPKYFPWFYLEGGFRFLGVYDHYQTSDVSSRLCFKSREIAQYAGKTFQDLYEKYFVIA